MPDRDLFCTTAPRGWVRPLRRFCEDADPAYFAHSAVAVLAKELRSGGISALRDLCLVVADRDSNSVSVADSFRRIREIESRSSSTNNRIAADAARRLVADISCGSRPQGNIAEILPSRVCEGMLRYFVIDRVRPELLCDTAIDAVAREAECIDTLQPYLQRLGLSLLSNGAERIRAPRVRIPRSSTRELLDEDIE